MIFGLYTKNEVAKIKSDLTTACTKSKEALLNEIADLKKKPEPAATVPAPASAPASLPIGYESIEYYGGKADSSFDNGAIAEKILADMDEGQQKNIFLPPKGAWRLGRPIIMQNKTLNFLGYGSPLAQNPSYFMVDEGIPGIIIKRTTYTGMGEAMLENIAIISANKKGPKEFDTPEGKVPVSGILDFQRAIIRNVSVYGFANHGVTIYGAIQHGTKILYDANVSKILFLQTANNGGSGIFIVGADSNGSCFYGISAIDNDGVGVDDNSFLGNGHANHHTNNNKQGGYRTVNVTNMSAFYGCYEEWNQPLSQFARPFEQTVFGGSIRKA
jgi:hypothetical protein